MAQAERILLETGNSTLKVARAAGDGAITLERHDDPEKALEILARSGGEILCAPVGRRFSEMAFRRLGGMLRPIERAELAGFIGTSYDTPETLGLDRVLNLLGMPGDGIAISCGTAITIDAVAGGVPCWGAIMPGFRTAAAGLHARVPVLPLVAPDDDAALPARSSHGSVANGILLGTAGGAAAIAAGLAAMLFGGGAHKVVLTGGDAPLMLRLWRGAAAEIDDTLLFRGMLNAVPVTGR